MEFPFQTQRLFNTDADGIAVLYAKECVGYVPAPSAARYHNRYTPGPNVSNKAIKLQQIAEILDQMGEASSKAQKLPHVITTMARFSGTNQRIFLKVEGNNVEGLLKVGERTIFYRDYSGKCKELNPLCVLDFYVHESMQRTGIGLKLFMKMLEHEGVSPHKLAYDRPSPKLLKFLEKHFDLTSFVPQNNNYVIYETYWKSHYEVPKRTIEKMKIGLRGGRATSEVPRKTADNHYFEVNPEYDDRERQRKTQNVPEELEMELIRREKEIAMIKQAEKDLDKQYKISTNRDQPINMARGSSKVLHNDGQIVKGGYHTETKLQPPWGTGPLPRVSEPRGVPYHSTGGNPGRLANTFSGFEGPLQPVQPPARMTVQATTGPVGINQQVSQQRGVVSSGNSTNSHNNLGKKQSSFTRELTTLDSQIDKTEAEIQRIRMNIESLQTQFGEKKGLDLKQIGPTFGAQRGYRTAGIYSRW